MELVNKMELILGEEPQCSNTIASTTNETNTIAKLSDDLLLLIFDYLATSYTAQIFFCVSSRRLRALFHLWAKNKFIQFDVHEVESMKLTDLIEFFQFGGQFIKSLKIDCDSAEKESLITEFVGEYCCNVEHLEFKNLFNDPVFKTLLNKITTLTHITFICYDSDDEPSSYDLSLNRNLKSFTLINGCYTGKTLGSLTNVQRLVLQNCLLWNSGELAISLRNLRTLELVDCTFDHSNISLYQKITEYCVHLEDLTFSGSDVNYEMLSQLPKLKRLTMIAWKYNDELQLNFIKALAERKSNDLEYLKLRGQINISNEHSTAIGMIRALKELHWQHNDYISDADLNSFNKLQNLQVFSINYCELITNMGLLRLLQTCKQLHTIEIRSCWDITDDFVLSAIDYLKNRRNNQMQQWSPLLISTFNSGISSDILKNSLYKQYVYLVEVKILKFDKLES